ncbi:putative NACHT domain-containing protein [Seiridium cardinale]
MGMDFKHPFEQAREEFVRLQSAILSEYRVQLASLRSGQELLAYIESLPVIAQSRHGNVNTEFVRRPIEKPEAYFRAADVIVSIDLLHGSTLWGAIRIIFQLDSNYLTFTDKFVSLLDQLELISPIFDRQWMTAALKHLITSRRAFIICMEIF